MSQTKLQQLMRRQIHCGVIVLLLLAGNSALGQDKPVLLLIGNKSDDTVSFVVACAKSNELAVFDVTNRQEIKRLSTGRFPVGVLIEPGDARAYVTYTADSIVAVFDLQTLRAVDKIAAGKQADGLSLVTQP